MKAVYKKAVFSDLALQFLYISNCYNKGQETFVFMAEVIRFPTGASSIYKKINQYWQRIERLTGAARSDRGEDNYLLLVEMLISI